MKPKKKEPQSTLHIGFSETEYKEILEACELMGIPATAFARSSILASKQQYEESGTIPLRSKIKKKDSAIHDGGAPLSEEQGKAELAEARRRVAHLTKQSESGAKAG